MTVQYATNPTDTISPSAIRACASALLEIRASFTAETAYDYLTNQGVTFNMGLHAFRVRIINPALRNGRIESVRNTEVDGEQRTIYKVR